MIIVMNVAGLIISFVVVAIVVGVVVIYLKKSDVSESFYAFAVDAESMRQQVPDKQFLDSVSSNNVLTYVGQETDGMTKVQTDTYQVNGIPQVHASFIGLNDVHIEFPKNAKTVIYDQNKNELPNQFEFTKQMAISRLSSVPSYCDSTIAGLAAIPQSSSVNPKDFSSF